MSHVYLNNPYLEKEKTAELERCPPPSNDCPMSLPSATIVTNKISQEEILENAEYGKSMIESENLEHYPR
jgi:hypothetical protein